MSSNANAVSRPNPPGGCSSHRREMALVGLQQRLQSDSLSDEERKTLEAEIARLEEELGL